MICLFREKPSKIVVSEALLRRGMLNVQQKNLLLENVRIGEIGFKGEVRADQFWLDLQLEISHFLLHGYETENRQGFSHQIDTVLLTKHFVLIVQLKNIGGRVRYDERTNQFIRELHGELLALPDPFAQVSQHQAFLKQLLREVGIALPILTAIIFTSTSSILEEMPTRFPIFKLTGLRFKLVDWLRTYPAQLSESMLCLVKEELLARYKLRMWQPPFVNFQVKPGAVCKCGSIMYYRRGKFLCSCGLVSKNALYQGLHDYRLLRSEWITNKELRDFFLI
ncbi:nuclease-related domain-containing protein [Lysinibacillus sp. KU-BSD001]|uniref:nuclease-related domain-containing protein n=1 Tax=Lysinibacillus sp. KU-BSD001 TaxID=3141328 RepID=UPI0036E24A58